MQFDAGSEQDKGRQSLGRDMETPLADVPGCALGPSGFRIYCTCSGTRKYQSTSAHSLGWRGVGGVPFVFLDPKGPDQIVPEAEREWGLQESGTLQERGQHDKGPWDAGLQVCPDRARHTSASRDVVDLFPH